MSLVRIKDIHLVSSGFVSARKVVHWICSELVRRPSLRLKRQRRLVELSPERYWLGSRSQEVGGGDCTVHYTVPIRLISALSSDESRFLLISKGKVTRRCPQSTRFEEKGDQKRRIEPKQSACQPNALPLGRTESQAAKLSGSYWQRMPSCQLSDRGLPRGGGQARRGGGQPRPGRGELMMTLAPPNVPREFDTPFSLPSAALAARATTAQ